MKKLMFILVSLIAITASAQVRSAAYAVRKQLFSPRTMVYPTIRATQNYPRITYRTFSAVATQKQLPSSQIRVTPIVMVSNSPMRLPEKTKFQEIMPVEANSSVMPLKDYKVNTSLPKNNVNWALLIFVSGTALLIYWIFVALYRMVRSDVKNHGEPTEYSQTAISNDLPYNIVLANGGGVLVIQ